MLDNIPAFTSLGGTVVTVVLFLWYLSKKDIQTKEMASSGLKAVTDNTKVLAELNTNIVLQREVLHSVCKVKE